MEEKKIKIINNKIKHAHISFFLNGPKRHDFNPEHSFQYMVRGVAKIRMGQKIAKKTLPLVFHINKIYQKRKISSGNFTKDLISDKFETIFRIKKFATLTL